MCPIKEILILCACICIFDAGVLIREHGQRVVVTRKGGYRGLAVEFPAGAHMDNIEVFYGIRYASLRQGNIRFIPPSSLTYKWQNVRDASTKDGVCPQVVYNVSDMYRHYSARIVSKLLSISKESLQQHEDCLFQNIYVPNKGKSKGNSL